MKTIVGSGLLLLAALAYVLTASSAVRDQLGAVAAALLRPIVIPIVELINVPAFVYCASLAILLAGVAACLIYRIEAVQPRLQDLRRVRSGIGDLPIPRARGAGQADAWPAARAGLGSLLQEHRAFTTAWPTFQSESLRIDGVPHRAFSSYAEAEPDARETGDGLMRHLPGYFTSVGLILTFLGLVVALYFAAKGFRTGDLGQARAAIIQLLNAASFKFLTSVSALVSALVVSLYGRSARSRMAADRARTAARIDGYLGEWREKIGAGRTERALAPEDLLRRFDALLGGVEALSSQVTRLVEMAEAKARDVAV